MRVLSFLLNVGAIILALSCSGDKPEPITVTTENYLVDRVESIGLERTTEVQVYVGDSLWEYINGGAELYHLYNFLEVATAYYEQDETEIVVDIYLFDSPEHAFGLYSMLRPDHSPTIDLGVEGFGSQANIVFVKGPYVVMLTGFDPTNEVAVAISKTAPIFEQKVVGTTSRPSLFDIFPTENLIAGSAKIYADSYLGLAFLKNVYTSSYALEEDTLTLFHTYDRSGSKFIDWKEQSQVEAGVSTSTDLAYDEGMVLRFSHSYYGDIIFGLKNGMLLGIVGYSDANQEFLRAWLDSVRPTS